MNKRLSKSDFNLLLYLIMSLPFLIISLMIHWAPSGVVPYTPFSSVFFAFSTGLLITIVMLSIILILISLKNFYRFLLFLILFFLIFCILSIIMSLKIHRDYFTLYFQLSIIFYILFLIKASDYRQNKSFMMIIFITTSILLVMTTFWLSMVAISIVNRTEPRWIESTFYNLYTFSLMLILLYQNYSYFFFVKRSIFISSSTLIIDDNDVSEVFSDEYILLFKSLLKNRNKCFEINEDLNLENTPDICKACIEKEYNSSKCKVYKGIYNKILLLKKILLMTALGTIIYPEKKFDIKEKGWQIKMKKNIIITISDS